MPKTNYTPSVNERKERRSAFRPLAPKESHRKETPKEQQPRIVLDDGITLRQVHADCYQAVREGLESILPQPTLKLTPALVRDHTEAAAVYLARWQMENYKDLVLKVQNTAPHMPDLTTNSAIFTDWAPEKVEPIVVESLRQLSAMMPKPVSWTRLVSGQPDDYIHYLAIFMGEKHGVYFHALAGLGPSLKSYVRCSRVRGHLASGIPESGVPHPDDAKLRAEFNKLVETSTNKLYPAIKRNFATKALENLMKQMEYGRSDLMLEYPKVHAWHTLLSSFLLPSDQVAYSIDRPVAEEIVMLRSLLISRFVREDVLPLVDTALSGTNLAESALLLVLEKRWQRTPMFRYQEWRNALVAEKTLLHGWLRDDDTDHDFSVLVRAIQAATHPNTLRRRLESLSADTLMECKAKVGGKLVMTILPNMKLWYSEWLCSARFLHSEHHAQVHHQLAAFLSQFDHLVAPYPSVCHQPLTPEQLESRKKWHIRTNRQVCACDKSLRVHATCLVYHGVMHWTQSLRDAYAQLTYMTLQQPSTVCTTTITSGIQ